jgi:uncharacterized protein YdaU (DUF1376 family)
MSDPNVIGMTNEEIGVYIKLLCFVWDTEDCEIKNDENYLARICRCDVDIIVSVIKLCFIPSSSGGEKFTHKRLQMERRKQDEWRKKCKKGGKNSAEKRASLYKKNKGSSRVVQLDFNTSSASATSKKSDGSGDLHNALGDGKIFKKKIKNKKKEKLDFEKSKLIKKMSMPDLSYQDNLEARAEAGETRAQRIVQSSG